MNWKQRYTKIKEGDFVEVISHNFKCGSEYGACCVNNGFIFGTICKVREVSENPGNLEGTIKIKSPSGTVCWFPEKCLKKVIK